MKFSKLFESPAGDVIMCEGNPSHFIQASANTIAIDVDGNVYRKTTVGGGADGWLLICYQGGPRGAEVHARAYFDTEVFSTSASAPAVTEPLFKPEPGPVKAKGPQRKAKATAKARR